MTQTLFSILEASISPAMDIQTQNSILLDHLDYISETATKDLGYNPYKVIVVKQPEDPDKYLVEFADNLERYMRDKNIGIVDAMAEVAMVNNIHVEDCTVVFDESCVSKINLSKVLQQRPLFSIARKW